MAKAKEITGLDCAASATDGVKLVLQTRFEEMFELREAALDWSDIEGVHDMRVASRRLRSALRDFHSLMRKREFKNFGKELKKVADALGNVRDQDVAIAALEDLKNETAEHEEIKRGIEKLIEERNVIRDKARIALTETITAGTLTLLREKLNEALRKAINEDKSQNRTFREAGNAIIKERQKEFLKLSRSIYTPFDINPLHDLRIAAKRLRYAMELFSVCFGEEMNSFAEEVSNMQGSLGELHDCDVWIEEMGNRLKRKSKVLQTVENQERHDAVIWLMSHFVKTRTKHYRAALDRWQNWTKDNFAKRLIENVNG